MKIVLAVVVVAMVSATMVYVIGTRPAWALRTAARSDTAARVMRGNNLSDEDIIDRDPWCEVLQQDGNGHDSWGWVGGPIFPAASRVEWDNDPRPAPRRISVPTNYNATRVGISPWCRLATIAQLDSAKRRRREAFDREWELVKRDACGTTYRQRNGSGFMVSGGCWSTPADPKKRRRP